MGTGQTHLNSDAKIADEGRPQGGEGTHKGCPYLHFSAKKPASSRQRRMEFAIAHYDLHSSRRYALGRAPTRGAPGEGAHRPYQLSSQALCPGEGTHKGRPYQLSSGVMPWGGHPQGAPLPIVFSRRYALIVGHPKILIPTRGGMAPTNCLLYRTHKESLCPRESYFNRYALKRAPTRGAPTRKPRNLIS